MADALKVLMKMRSLRREDVERLEKLPLKEACREIAAMLLLDR